MEAVKSVQTVFNSHGMYVVNWVGIFSPVSDKPKGLAASQKLGREIVGLIENAPKYPEEYTPNHISYGTHTH
jgi:hypothetical protein